MTTYLVNKMEALAAKLETNVSAEIAAYAPRLRIAAADAAHKLEAWTAAVDHWVELHFQEAAEKAREEAGAAYRAAVTFAHELHIEATAKTN